MTETELDDSYEHDAVETRWRNSWHDSDVYAYAADDRPDYIIDTPPPYPTGNLHIGNALGWCYMDFAARYKRLQGFDVLFPQGWDCHGLPTEVKVEELHDIHRTDVPRDEFREMCIEFTESNIDEMRQTMRTLGFSHDWNHEYKTMDPNYWGRTQLSFVEMADDGYVYRDEHPVNWCPRCETAIADAEVETIDRAGTLHHITFSGIDAEAIDIATTRPELLAACVAVAVHPDDERYVDRIGDEVTVPLFGQPVEVIQDDAVDSDFGSGAVMICTFGDKQDVTWWAEYDLDLRVVFTRDGHLNENAGEYAGLTIQDAKAAIVADLTDAGQLIDTEPTDQSVGTCWRCDTPIEILSTEQWFVTVNQQEILEYGAEVNWIPDHMFVRLRDWTEGMDWDWVISRQRVFATPIPAWFCEECGYTHIAASDEIPVDPTATDPAIGTCPECDGTEWTGETDVMDTWMDSSISPLYVAGWPDRPYSPVQLREQGHDIIRTWAFYTILRTAALVESIPWEDALINGMVFGDDGNKMSKSRGNFVQPETVVEDYGADAFRQAMAIGGQPGSDIQFQWKEVTSASRFLTKIWNISRFAIGHFDDRTPTIEAPAYRTADQWILQRLSTVAREVEADMDAYRFDAALRKLRQFIWHDLADDYLELVKGRLYEGRPGERDAARHALYLALTASLRMLSPFSPFITEEIWHHIPGTDGSVHNAEWPVIDTEVTVDWDDVTATVSGDLITDVASTIRGWKSDTGRALNADLERVVVYPTVDDRPAIDTYDLSEAVNAPVYIEWGRPNVELVPVDIEIDQSIIGPTFRDKASAVIGALKDMDPSAVKAQIDTHGEIELDTNGEVVVVAGDAVEVVHEQRADSGEEVVVLETRDATLLVFP